MAKNGTMPSAKKIVAAHTQLLSEISDKFDDFNPQKSCWACGRYSSDLERAHLIPDSAGGSTDPTNLILLCHECHREQPDNASVDAQLLWLREHEPRGLATFKWLRTNIVEPMLKQADDLAPKHGDRLVGAWIDSLGDTQEARSKAMIALFRGAYPAAGRLWRDGLLNTAKYEVMINFSAWIKTKQQDLLVTWLQSQPQTTGLDQSAFSKIVEE